MFVCLLEQAKILCFLPKGLFVMKYYDESHSQAHTCVHKKEDAGDWFE